MRLPILLPFSFQERFRFLKTDFPLFFSISRRLFEISDRFSHVLAEDLGDFRLRNNRAMTRIIDQAQTFVCFRFCFFLRK